tara:strand:- start:2542 stop:3087 length:546 start_codon:yes stop_codon:yes gene_type:complete
MILWIKLLVLAVLSFSQESRHVELQASSQVNCDYILYKLEQQGGDYARLADLMLLEKERFQKWQEARWVKSYRYKQYLRLLEELEEISLLVYFSDFPYLSTRSIEIQASWPITSSFDASESDFHLPGYLPMSLESLETLRGVQFEQRDQELSMNMLVSPLDYCLQPQVVVLGANGESLLAN